MGEVLAKRKCDKREEWVTVGAGLQQERHEKVLHTGRAGNGSMRTIALCSESLDKRLSEALKECGARTTWSERTQIWQTESTPSS